MIKDKQPMRKGSLGKGMSSLLGDINLDSLDDKPVRNERISGQLEAEVIRIKVGDIEPNPYQPRKVFDDAKLRELSASLKQDGFLQPIVVTRSEIPGKFVIIAGERRYRASKLAGFETVPVIVKDTNTEEMLRLALIENIQRANLNVIEEAEAYASLIRDYGLTQEQCADKVGKERSSVTNTLRLLSLPRELQDDIIDSRLSMGHGRAMLSLEDKKLMLRCRDIVIKKNLSVRQTEQLVKTFKDAKEGGAKVGASIKDEADLQYITESLRSYLHTKVKLAGTTSRGKIEISYFSAAELERLMKLMGHKF
jgi:ParB family chromosome partitioning protein